MVPQRSGFRNAAPFYGEKWATNLAFHPKLPMDSRGLEIGGCSDACQECWIR